MHRSRARTNTASPASISRPAPSPSPSSPEHDIPDDKGILVDARSGNSYSKDILHRWEIVSSTDSAYIVQVATGGGGGSKHGCEDGEKEGGTDKNVVTARRGEIFMSATTHNQVVEKMGF